MTVTGSRTPEADRAPIPLLGAVFPAMADPKDLPGFATRLEVLGFDALWLIEDCFLSGGLTMAATALAVTDRIRVGVGLLPATVRNPAIAAMEIGTLARMHPGRFEATMGHGVAEWMQQIGALPARRLKALEETVQSVRALLAGETVTIAGSHVQLSDVVLENAPEVAPPVLVGTTGPKGLALAARSADGALLPEGCGPSFVSRAREELDGGRCVVYAWFSIDEDPALAVHRIMPAVDRWLDWDLFPHPRAAAGVATAPPEGDPRRRQVASELSVCGDADACADAVRRFAAAGADTLVLAPPSEDYAVQLEEFAARVLPKLVAR